MWHKTVDLEECNKVTSILLLQEGSQFWKTWKRRWFVLNDRCLYYFVHSAHTRSNFPEGIIPLESIGVRPVEDRDGQFVFEIYPEVAEVIKEGKTDSNGVVVQGNRKYYRSVLAAPNLLFTNRGWGSVQPHWNKGNDININHFSDCQPLTRMIERNGLDAFKNLIRTTPCTKLLLTKRLPSKEEWTKVPVQVINEKVTD